MATFLNPYTDYGFKKIFGEEVNKPLLIDFLNSLLPAHHKISELEFKSTEKLGRVEADRKLIYDIYCESLTGERFIVELQRAKQAYFKERTVFYASVPILEQGERGNWRYDLKAVYCISILDFVFDNPTLHPPQVVHTVKLKDDNNHIFYDKLTFIYLEMPNFALDENQLITQRDKWLFFIKNLKDLQVIPMILQNSDVFKKAFETAELANLSRDEWLKYENSLKAYRDTYAIETYQKEQAFAEGLEEGLQQGIEKGSYFAKLATAKKLKSLGLSLEIIQQATDLSAEEIINLE